MRHSRVEARIDLDAVMYNMEQMHANIMPQTKMVAVIKSNAYGHGAQAIADLLEEEEYMWGFAVASTDEAVRLRIGGTKKPILILGVTFAEDYEWMVQHEIRPAVVSLKMAQQLSHAATLCGKDIKIHIALDTGMSRIGFRPNAQSLSDVIETANLPGIQIEGIFTHFARADETHLSPAYRQLHLFQTFIDDLKSRGLSIPVCHCSNSAGIIRILEANMDMVRAGISIYGMYPSDEVEKEPVDLHPVMSLVSHVSFMKDIPAGTEISYGGTFCSEHPMRVATIPVGYADGYPRGLSGKGYVLIRGHKANILGRVCMDQFMVDISDIPEADIGDEVILIGSDGDHTISIEKIASWSGRFFYEVPCLITPRVPRTYYQDGHEVEAADF